MSPTSSVQKHRGAKRNDNGISFHPSRSVPLHLKRLLWALLTGVELVQAVQRRKGGCAKGPRGKGAEHGKLALVQVVGKQAVEADVRVDHQAECKRAVEDRRRAVLGKSSSNERDECDGETTFKRPVVGAMCCVGFGERSGVVDRALDVGCKE